MGARAIQQINDEVNGTNWRDGNGRKPKCDEIRAFASEHREMSNRQIALELGVSRNTVNKWLRGVTFKSGSPGIWEVDGMLYTNVPSEWLEFDETDNDR